MEFIVGGNNVTDSGLKNSQRLRYSRELFIHGMIISKENYHVLTGLMSLRYLVICGEETINLLVPRKHIIARDVVDYRGDGYENWVLLIHNV